MHRSKFVFLLDQFRGGRDVTFGTGARNNKRAGLRASERRRGASQCLPRDGNATYEFCASHSRPILAANDLEPELLAQPIAVGDVHRLQPLELYQQVHSFTVAETLAPALGNDAALTFEVVLAGGDVALG